LGTLSGDVLCTIDISRKSRDIENCLRAINEKLYHIGITSKISFDDSGYKSNNTVDLSRLLLFVTYNVIVVI